MPVYAVLPRSGKKDGKGWINGEAVSDGIGLVHPEELAGAERDIRKRYAKEKNGNIFRRDL